MCRLTGKDGGDAGDLQLLSNVAGLIDVDLGATEVKVQQINKI